MFFNCKETIKVKPMNFYFSKKNDYNNEHKFDLSCYARLCSLNGQG